MVERRDDGTVAILAANRDPILKLGESGTVLYRFGGHVLDAHAAQLSPEALEALRDWSSEALGEAPGGC